MKKYLKHAAVLSASFVAAAAPGLDLAVQPKLLPDAYDLGGYLYQFIGRTFEAMRTDRITLALAMCAVIWLMNRYLFHKPAKWGIGEYLLCLFFSVMHLLDTAVRQCGTVAVLAENAFQVVKAGLWIAGIFLLYLCAMRALNEWLTKPKTGSLPAIWQKHPFLCPLIVLAVCWLPQLILRYPGVMFMDTVLQWRQAMYLDARTIHQQPVGTLFYGWLLELAMNSEYTNIVYFVLTLIKTALCLVLFSYALDLMSKARLPAWLCWLTMILFAVSPAYMSWISTISKDSDFMIATMMVGIMALDLLIDCRRFLHSSWRMAVLAGGMTLMVWARSNGDVIAPVMLAGISVLAVSKLGFRNCKKSLACLCAALLVCFGAEKAICVIGGFKNSPTPDMFAIPLQQTARTVKYHADEIPQEEREAIDAFVVFDAIGKAYEEHIVDHVRDQMRDKQNRSPEIIEGYFRTWFKQMARYPVEYIDAALHMNGFLFDLQTDAPFYISFTNNEIDYDIYRHSFNLMEFYDAEEMIPFYTLQRALAEWYHRFSQIPLIGWFASLGFCWQLMIVLIYLGWVNRRWQSMVVWIPAVFTIGMIVFCPIVYTRYMLPTIASLPLCLASYLTEQKAQEKMQ